MEDITELCYHTRVQLHGLEKSDRGLKHESQRQGLSLI